MNQLLILWEQTGHIADLNCCEQLHEEWGLSDLTD